MRVYLKVLRYWGKLGLAYNYLLVSNQLIFFSGPIIHRTKGTDRSMSKRADRKINRNKTPGRRKRDLRRKIWHKGIYRGQKIYKNIAGAAKDRIRRLNNFRYQLMRRRKTINKRKIK